jgi:5-bromo-4-chloroindolyl phosphate hydrolysis protein
MKKVFAILGGIFAVIIVIIVIVAAIFIKLDREATAFIQDVVPKIVTNWNSQELVDRATPELIKRSRSRAISLTVFF